MHEFVARPSRFRSTAVVLSAVALSVVSACSGAVEDPKLRSRNGVPSSAPVHAAPHWDYDTEGPEHWAEIDKEYLTCEGGHEQSPIDLPRNTQLDPAEHITIEYRPVSSVDLVNNGHTVQANLPPDNGNRVLIGAEPFELVQFHFHLPSEHRVDGEESTMELHLVHKSSTGSVAVLGVLMQASVVGESAFAPVLNIAPNSPDATVSLPGSIDPRTFLPPDFDQFRYQGSLTTPPCTEGVSWTVLEHPVAVAPDEADAYRALFPHSNRPTQPLNGRSVVLAGN